MLFNSLEFLVFLPLVLIGYYFLRSHRTVLLLASSYFFYGWWNWSYLVLILMSTFVDFYCGKKLETESLSRVSRRSFLGLSLIVNLGILFFFKYFNFFNGELAKLFGALRLDYLIPYSDFLLPMGVSFYTFQTLSYTIDIYNGKIKAEHNFTTFALFVSFFPQLVAGPIERAGHLIEQIKKNKDIHIDDLTSGLGRILFGLFKKVVIADRLALLVNPIYNDPYSFDGSMLILATIFFAFQIYCDFSGYSDIAIGIARIFGINLIENFKSPYLSPNIRAFWSRWHISLSTWFRDYVYIPLGGNRGKLYRNILIVFVVSGLWHGANWTFILWGTLHGIYLLVTVLAIKSGYFDGKEFLKPIGVATTFVFVCVTWIFFRANSIYEAFYIISNLADFNSQYVIDTLYQVKTGILDPSSLTNSFNLDFGKINFQFSVGDLILSLIFIPTLVFLESSFSRKKLEFAKRYKFLVMFMIILLIMLFGVFSENQFIYFEF